MCHAPSLHLPPRALLAPPLFLPPPNRAPFRVAAAAAGAQGCSAEDLPTALCRRRCRSSSSPTGGRGSSFPPPPPSSSSSSPTTESDTSMGDDTTAAGSQKGSWKGSIVKEMHIALLRR